ncbi:MAG: Holliday junction branch migration protein RuvA [Saprospiraceae bacterium]|nr:MAG: Holliday junction branch migration protein RuvA [Saprospiraceae bacterium]
MITYIKGTIAFKTPAYVIIEAGGIGYHINISLNTYAKVEKLEHVKLLTYYHVKEDAHTLYGFAEDEERNLFAHLISVSGVGPSTAQVMLSTMTPDELRAAIIGENEVSLRKVKGIGAKTAKQIILDLKSRLMKAGGEFPLSLTPANNTMRQEALSALLSLQVNKIQAQKALNKVLQEQPDIQNVEDLVRLALKQLS